MITLFDWANHCSLGEPLFYSCNGKIMDMPSRIPVAYDKTLGDWVLCLCTNNITFKEIFKTRQECADYMIDEIKKEYL